MNRREFLALAGLTAISGCASMPGHQASRPPNIVIIYADDQGYGDLGCYGSQIRTPNIDRLAAEGVRFTDFYVAQAVCSASRAALLTGCYPNRVGILGALGPGSKVGIADREVTLAELLKQKGYATAIFGKWHLGDRPEFLPTRHGFDEYFGLPYSNDMWPKHPSNPKAYPPLPLYDGETVVQTMPDQAQLTTWYTERAVNFIERNRNRPFFLYVPHNMPHVPLFVSEKFAGKSGQGIYGDVTQEIDWSVGQILAALRKHNLDENSLVIYASDNGPWLPYGDHAGSSGGLREGKGSTWEGGVRVPCIMRWKGRIEPRRVCSAPAMTIDLFPTIAGLAGAALPDHPIDGRDIWDLVSGKTQTSPQEAYYFYWGQHLQAVRSGKWKLHFPHGYQTLAGKPGGTGGAPVKTEATNTELALFDLENDRAEKTNVADRHPQVVARLAALADRMREELGDSATKQDGRGVRKA